MQSSCQIGPFWARFFYLVLKARLSYSHPIGSRPYPKHPPVNTDVNFSRSRYFVLCKNLVRLMRKRGRNNWVDHFPKEPPPLHSAQSTADQTASPTGVCLGAPCRDSIPELELPAGRVNSPRASEAVGLQHIPPVRQETKVSSSRAGSQRLPRSRP
jgi:hypothetical protein